MFGGDARSRISEYDRMRNQQLRMHSLLHRTQFLKKKLKSKQRNDQAQVTQLDDTQIGGQNKESRIGSPNRDRKRGRSLSPSKSKHKHLQGQDYTNYSFLNPSDFRYLLINFHDLALISIYFYFLILSSLTMRKLLGERVGTTNGRQSIENLVLTSDLMPQSEGHYSSLRLSVDSQVSEKVAFNDVNQTSAVALSKRESIELYYKNYGGLKVCPFNYHLQQLCDF
jgi:hypothetical protein